jgi:chorismate lyase/3-hydroxybenzoate synthase
MNQANAPAPALADAPRTRYCRDIDPIRLLDAPGTLAVLGFNPPAPDVDDPRFVRVPLAQVHEEDAVFEHWYTDAPVRHGRDGALRWSEAGDWLFTMLDLDERDWGGPEPAAEQAYRTLCAFLGGRPQRHVQRLWNYLGAINQGSGDSERYKHFCAGRLRGMGDFFAEGFPAATAIGHRQAVHRLQLYCLSATHPGTRIENPRQLSAWRYPRQYGPTPPSFARAMRLAGQQTLAISGTASITGHSSQHHDDLQAQLSEILANLHTLLRSSGLPERFNAHDPLKVYVRHAEHAAEVDAFLAEHAPDAPRVLLLGDVCRSELLVEIDGWHYA